MRSFLHKEPAGLFVRVRLLGCLLFFDLASTTPFRSVPEFIVDIRLLTVGLIWAPLDIHASTLSLSALEYLGVGIVGAQLFQVCTWGLRACSRRTL